LWRAYVGWRLAQRRLEVSLRANTYVALTGAVFLAITLIFAATLFAGREIVHGVERNLAAAKMLQVEREIDAETHAIDSLAHDWGSWNDAVEFVNGTAPRFAEENAPDSALQQLGCDALFVQNLEGDRLIKAYSPVLRGNPTAVDALGAALAPGQGFAIPANGDPKVGKCGVIGTGNTVVLVAARPIVSATETGAVHGTVVFARVLGTEALKRLSAVAGVTLKAALPSDPSIPPDVRRTILSAGSTDRIVISVERPLTMTGYLRVDSVDGLPALVLYSPIVPVNYDAALQSIAALVMTLLVGGVLWSIAAFWVVDNTSLSRLTWLRDSMTAIADGGQLSGRIALEGGGRNEATTVAQAVNSMLDALGRSHEQVRQSEERHRVLVETMPDAVFTLTLDGVFTFANSQAEWLTGLKRDELVGLPYVCVLSRESARFVRQRIRKSLSAGGRPIAVVFVDASGREFPVDLSISPVHDSEGNTIATTWVARDVTERREFENRLVYLASHDHLTGLFNRRRFEEEVSQRLAETSRHGGVGALLWIDLDNFKAVNDSFGHRVGDELLRQVAGVLREQSREGQVLARLGGDEFAILLPRADEIEAVKAAERILGELSNLPLRTDGHPLRISASVGVATYPAHAEVVDQLLLRADTAMYSAKEDGRNRVCMYSPDEAWPQGVMVRREWARRVEEALANDLLVPYAQPIIDLHSGRVTAYELLVRMIGSDGSVIGPAEFLCVAEDLGLIAEVDRRMLRWAVEFLGEEATQASGVRLFVNLSAKTIAEPSFSAFVHEQLDASGVDPRQLGFELTETVLVTNMTRAHELIKHLRGLGCGFALDDFGTGFSSITYLRHMPVDVLKIDGGLVREMLVSDQDKHLVYAIVELARCLGVSVTAEYVENEAILELLKACGADNAQGYHLGVPKPAVEVFRETAEHEGVGAE
jgi:diguanylate cyclase (GGDEF)-like protein/PAS domain S-box-containing protein